MNLYKIEFLHAAPKDTELGIKCLLLAKNDESVYEWIKSEPEINGSKLHNDWSMQETYDEEFEIFNDAFDVIGVEKFKEKIIRLTGEMDDDSYDYSDAYYGITLFGWSLLKENVETDYAELIELGVVFKDNK